MNILFVLYGDLNTNTANPIILFSRELQNIGHECVITIPSNTVTKNTDTNHHDINTLLFEDVFNNDGKIFSNGFRADIVHACTPRIGVVNFITKYMSLWPSPLVVCLEDNEGWISNHYLQNIEREIKLISNKKLSVMLPPTLSDPDNYHYFIGLSDLAIILQEKLSSEIIFDTPFEVIPWGVNLDEFTPGIRKVFVEKFPKIEVNERIIVYHGGLNGITISPIKDLCQAVINLNQSGVPCKLIRAGINRINFLEELSPNAKDYIYDIGLIKREQLPTLLSYSDIFIQPGRIDPFEDLRLPSKLLEFFAMGKPVVLPNVNIANQLRNGVDAIILNEGTPEEIAKICIELFQDPSKMSLLGANARKFAEKNYDLKEQTKKLIAAYKAAKHIFYQQKNHSYWLKAYRKNIKQGLINKFDLLLASSPQAATSDRFKFLKKRIGTKSIVQKSRNPHNKFCLKLMYLRRYFLPRLWKTKKE